MLDNNTTKGRDNKLLETKQQQRRRRQEQKQTGMEEKYPPTPV